MAKCDPGRSVLQLCSRQFSSSSSSLCSVRREHFFERSWEWREGEENVCLTAPVRSGRRGIYVKAEEGKIFFERLRKLMGFSFVDGARKTGETKSRKKSISLLSLLASAPFLIIASFFPIWENNHRVGSAANQQFLSPPSLFSEKAVATAGGGGGGNDRRRPPKPGATTTTIT